MKKKCPRCNLVNYQTASECARCGSALLDGAADEAREKRGPNLLRRAVVCLIVLFAALGGFYASMVFSAKGLGYDEKRSIYGCIQILERQGFADEAFLLRRLAVFRSTDNWLNSSVVKENAFAATNFPFGIVTVYSDFFTYPVDDVERAAILLHEAKHMQGADEPEAYEFVWRNRKKLGWTTEIYSNSTVFLEIRKQTKEYAPGVFVCDVNPNGDCTE